MTREEFKNMIKAVNLAVRPHDPGVRFGLKVGYGHIGGSAAVVPFCVLTAESSGPDGREVWLTRSYVSGFPGEREPDWSCLLAWAAENMFWPKAGSAEEMSIRLAVEGTSGRIARRLRWTLGNLLLPEGDPE